MQSAQQLRQAADAMRRAAANGQQASGAQSAEALERLRQAERQLQRTQTGRAERDVADAVRRRRSCVNEQKDDRQRRSTAWIGRAERIREQVQQLLDRKAAMEQKVGELEKQIDRAAADMRRDEREASRKMTEAATAIRDNRVRDKIRYSGSMVRSGMATSDTENFEREIGSNLEAVRNRLNEAQAALGQPRPDQQQSDALNRARQLARNVESLGERARERAKPGCARQPQGAQRGARGCAGEGSEGAAKSTREGAQQGQQGAQRTAGQGAQQGQQGQQERSVRVRSKARAARPGRPAGPRRTQRGRAVRRMDAG